MHMAARAGFMYAHSTYHGVGCGWLNRVGGGKTSQGDRTNLYSISHGRTAAGWAMDGRVQAGEDVDSAEGGRSRSVGVTRRDSE